MFQSRTFTVNVVNESQRRELLDESQLKEVQIKELQNMLAFAKEARSRQQSRLLQITSIAEARFVTKHLFYLVSNMPFTFFDEVTKITSSSSFFIARFSVRVAGAVAQD